MLAIASTTGRTEAEEPTPFSSITGSPSEKKQLALQEVRS
jgi:hypothetical protein